MAWSKVVPLAPSGENRYQTIFYILLILIITQELVELKRILMCQNNQLDMSIQIIWSKGSTNSPSGQKGYQINYLTFYHLFMFCLISQQPQMISRYQSDCLDKLLHMRLSKVLPPPTFVKDS